MACLEFYQFISSSMIIYLPLATFSVLLVLFYLFLFLHLCKLLCLFCHNGRKCCEIIQNVMYWFVKKATSILFSTTLDITKCNTVSPSRKDEDEGYEYILTLAGHKYKFPSFVLLNPVIHQVVTSEFMIILSVFWAILPYFFFDISNSCSPYNAEGVDCFPSSQTHHGLYTGLNYTYVTINQSACALNEPDYNITIPINCSDFFWYKQYGNSAQEVPVICFKISYSNPFIALAILTSILKTVLPVLFQVVLFVYLNVLGNCLKCLVSICQCTRGSLPALMIIQPTIAFVFIVVVSVCIMLIIPEHIFYFLNEFGGEASTTLMLCVFVVGFLSYPCWFVLAFFKVEENEPLTLYETIQEGSDQMNHGSYKPINNTTRL